jgi:hypothetical protein
MAGEGEPSDPDRDAAVAEALDITADIAAAAFDDRIISDDDALRASFAALRAWAVSMRKAGREVTSDSARAAMPRLIAKAREIAGNPPAREA